MKNTVLRLLGLALLTTSFISTEAMAAGTCEWVVTRTACAGKEEKSYEKCKGKATCEPETKKVKDEAACKVAATHHCSNARLDITKSKVISVKFDGKQISDNVCDPKSKEFNGPDCK